MFLSLDHCMRDVFLSTVFIGCANSNRQSTHSRQGEKHIFKLNSIWLEACRKLASMQHANKPVYDMHHSDVTAFLGCSGSIAMFTWLAYRSRKRADRLVGPPY